MAWHTHYYFHNEQQKEQALEVARLMLATFAAAKGTLYNRLDGPHATHQIEIFSPMGDLDMAIEFAQAHRGDLTAMSHPITGNNIQDHDDEHATWMGDRSEIDFRPQFFVELEKRRAGVKWRMNPAAIVQDAEQPANNEILVVG